MNDYRAYDEVTERDIDGVKYAVATNVKDFDLVHIFESGQAFRWKMNEDSSYTGIVGERISDVFVRDGNLYVSNSSREDFLEFWENYFDLKTDYADIKQTLCGMDESLETATEFGTGIRIMNQDVWEMIMTFIISANNRIPMIKRAVEGLSEKFGDYAGEHGGRKFFKIPTCDVLAEQRVEDVRVSGVGFRDKYLVASAKMISSGEIDLPSIVRMEYRDAKKELMRLPGVGEKVADCIILFSLGKREAFPVDTWVKKVMEHFYLKKDTALSEIRRFSEGYFGELAGYAQQYLFYYAREKKLG